MLNTKAQWGVGGGGGGGGELLNKKRVF